MLRILILLALVAPLTHAEDYHLSQKMLKELIGKMPLVRLEGSPPSLLVCAIPLKEARATPGRSFDSIARPSSPANIDRIAFPTPIPACPVSAVKKFARVQ
jgi:hypothetical protein